jgi:hypothetical protein
MRTRAKLIPWDHFLRLPVRLLLGRALPSRATHPKRPSKEAGVEFFEFALIAPLLLTLILGILWMGRPYSVYQGLRGGA